jgi:hypothetical protein
MKILVCIICYLAVMVASMTCVFLAHLLTVSDSVFIQVLSIVGIHAVLIGGGASVGYVLNRTFIGPLK